MARNWIVGLLCALLGAVSAQGTMVYRLPEAVTLDGTKSGPSMDGDLIPEYPVGLTLTAWVRPSSFEGKHHEIFRLEADSWRILFSFQTQGSMLSFGLGPAYSELKAATTPADLADGRWHYVCAVYGRGRRAVWIDGVRCAEGSFGTVRVGRGYKGYVGSLGGTGEIFRGTIDDLQIHDVELKAGDLAARYAEGLATRGLVWTWNGAAGAAWSAAANWQTNGTAAAAAPDEAAIAAVAAPATVALAPDALSGTLRLTGTGAVAFTGAYTNEAVRGECAPGVTLDLAEGAELRLRQLWRGTERVFAGIYTGTGDVGTRVAWLTGKGVVRVAQARSATYPTEIPVAEADGWYEFGLASGWAMGEMYNGALASGNRQYIRGERVVFDTLALPSNASVRLVGGLAADRIPADTIGTLDVSRLRRLMLEEAAAPFADGSPFILPLNCDMYYTPGTLAYHAASNCWYYASVNNYAPYDEPLEVDGWLQICGNGNVVNPRRFTGALSGTNTLRITNFGNALRTSGPFLFTGTLTGFQEGCPLWIDTACVSGTVESVSLSSAAFGGGFKAGYAANGLLFGRDNSDETADNPLRIRTLTGNAWIQTDAQGHTWRQGGSLIVWGGNTVHIGTLVNSLHVMARRDEQDCDATLYQTSYVSKGLGNLVVDKFNAGTLYASTNVNVTIGSVTAGSTASVDYTLRANGVNPRTLAFTGEHAAATVRVVADDLAMLPARLTGFRGSVMLTNTLARAYAMPVDFAAGPDGLCNPVGCAGSGTLAQAPASGSIDVQFDTSHEAQKPVKGDYALARFTAGGEKLAGWTVTLNGAAATSATVRGMNLTLCRDTTGLYLRVRRTGLYFCVR